MVTKIITSVSLDPLHRLQTYSRGKDIAKKVFSGNLSATKFVASAPTIESIPNLGQIPEVNTRPRTNLKPTR